MLRRGGWTVRTGEAAGVLVLRREGPERPDGDGLDGLRALCVAAWSGAPDGPADVRVVADGDPAASTVEPWRLHVV